MPWISPTSHNDPTGDWTSEANAYDENTATFTFANPVLGFPTGSLFLNHSALWCDSIRYWVSCGVDISTVTIRVQRDGAWVTVHNGAFVNGSWQEINFTEGYVDSIDFSFYYGGMGGDGTAQINEVDYGVSEYGTEDYPEIFVQHDDGTGWENIFQYVSSFNVKDGGVKKIPHATINLHNENGRFTSAGGSNTISTTDSIRIVVSVRAVWDNVFLGSVEELDPDEYIQGVTPLRSTLTVVAKSLHGRRLLDETITVDYFDMGWPVRSDVINNAIDDPDTGNNLLITLNHDAGVIDDIGPESYPKNMSRDAVLDTIQVVCEEMGYDGYIDDFAGTGADTGTVYMRRYRTVPSLVAVNPAIHLNLSTGLVKCSPKTGVQNVKNYIFVWGGTDEGFPPADAWTERGLARYAGPAWTPVGANTVTDDAAIFYNTPHNEYSIRITTTAGLTSPWANFDITLTGYFQPQNPANNFMNFNDGRFKYIELWARYSGFAGGSMGIQLWDSSGKAVRLVLLKAYPMNTWVHENGFRVETVADKAAWALVVGVGVFDWTEVTAIEIIGTVDVVGGGFLNVDLLHVTDAVWLIDPIVYPTLNPIHTDSSAYRKVYHYSDDTIKCFEQAYLEGERVLLENKDDFTHIEITEGAKPWAKPSMYLQVTIPTWDIANDDYRIMETTLNYDSESKLLRSTFDLLVYDAEVSAINIRSATFWGTLQLDR